MKKSGDLIESQAALAEKRKRLIEDVVVADKEVEKTGLVYRAGDFHRYIRARASGKKVPAPKLVKR